MSNKEVSSPKSILHGNDAFVRKILSVRPNGEQSFRRDYFSDKQSMVPFTWEEEPGTPKTPSTLDFVPHVSPPPSSNWRPLQIPKPDLRTHPKSSCFFIQPRMRINKRKKALMMLKGKQHDGDSVEGSDESGVFS